MASYRQQNQGMPTVASVQATPVVSVNRLERGETHAEGERSSRETFSSMVFHLGQFRVTQLDLKDSGID